MMEGLTLKEYVECIMKETKGINYSGVPIDKNVLKNYILQIEESEGFNITDFPGLIMGVTNIIPAQHVIDNPTASPDEYLKLTYLAALSIAEYNKKHGAHFKLGMIEKSNVKFCGKAFEFYITFTGIEVNRGLVFNLLLMLMIMFKGIIMLMFLMFWSLLTLQLVGRVHLLKKLDLIMKCYLEYFRASKSEIADEFAVCKTFQALVIDNQIDIEQEVQFCRDFQMPTKKKTAVFTSFH